MSQQLQQIIDTAWEDRANISPKSAPKEVADAVEHVVATWPQIREQAVQDAGVARDRHAPETYRRTVAELVLPARGTTADGTR